MTTPVPAPIMNGTAVGCVPWERVRPMSDQPRQHFDAKQLDELAESIRAIGQVVPALVVAVKGDAKHLYELVDGERRWRAVQIAGVATLRVEVCEGADRETLFARSVAANFARAGHHPIEIALACDRMRKAVTERTGRVGDGYEAVAAAIGKGVQFVKQYVGLLRLHPDVRDLLGPETPKKRRIGIGVASRIAGLSHPDQLAAVAKIQASGRSTTRGADLVLDDMSCALRTSGRPKRPSDHLKVLEGRLERFAEDLDGYNPSRIEAMLRGRQAFDRAALGRKITRLLSIARELARSVEASDRGSH